MLFIFSMERHEFADEEEITEDFSYGVVSALYEKMGLNGILDILKEEKAENKILNGEPTAEQYFGNHPAVMVHLKQTLEYLKSTNTKKAKDKETLAFHWLTLPDIEKIS